MKLKEAKKKKKKWDKKNLQSIIYYFPLYLECTKHRCLEDFSVLENAYLNVKSLVQQWSPLLM